MTISKGLEILTAMDIRTKSFASPIPIPRTVTARNATAIEAQRIEGEDIPQMNFSKPTQYVMKIK